MKFYGNMSCFFNEQELWTFNKFITEHLDEQIIYIDQLFYQQLNPNHEAITIQFNIQEIKKIEIQEQKRTYKEEFLSQVNLELYNFQITLGELTKLLIKNYYVDRYELLIYKQFQNKFIIESGKMFGVSLVFYDKNDIEHKHSLFLVDYFVPQTWKEMYRKIRLAQEVKKMFLLVIFDEKDEIKQTRLISNFQ